MKKEIERSFHHCNPLQVNYRVELLHREISEVITGNEFTEYNFFLFWLHFFPCFRNIEIVGLVPEMCTGNYKFILHGIPVVITGNGFVVYKSCYVDFT